MPPSFLSKFVKPPPGPKEPHRARTIASGTTSDGTDMPSLVLTESIEQDPSDPPTDIYHDSSHRRAMTFNDKDLSTPTEQQFRLRSSSQPSSIIMSTTDDYDAPPQQFNSYENSSFKRKHRPASSGSNASASSSTYGAPQESVVQPHTISPIVESPSPIRSTFHPETISPQLLPQREHDLEQTLGNSSKKNHWRSNSTSRKQSLTNRRGTGIAGALAASGLAMVNPAVSPLPGMQQQFSQLPGRPISPANPPTSSSTLLKEPSPRSRKASTSASIGSVQTGNSAHGSVDNEESDGGYESPDLDLNEDDMPVTGFAVASNKRNADFHELFRTVPEGDYLIEDYGCALQREILIQGRLYISENHICFHANIFGWITDLIIPMYDIIVLEKKMTAFVIPNAIQITTRKTKYSFASFLARDTVFEVIHNIWRTARPDVSSIGNASARASVEEVVSSAPNSVDGMPITQYRESEKIKNKSTRTATYCYCSKKGEHYPEKVLECVVPGTPDKVYTLMFASAFMKEFMREEQRLIDIQISDWTPSGSDPKLLARNMSYIKPLSGGLGPKQTKCEIRDETIHLDYDDYVTTVTTTRTPDVPSGSVFSVKTRTCLMWAGKNSTRIIVTTAVEWTGRSFIKSLIERSALEGQKSYHSELERHLKQYISLHMAEFLPEGAVEATEVAEEVATFVNSQAEIARTQHTLDDVRRAPDRRGLQWALDTFTGAYKVGKQSATGAIELIRDAWDTSSSTSILYGLLAVLLISNIYTFLMVGKREEVGRRKAESRKSLERQQWIGDTVRILLHELRETPVALSNNQPIATSVDTAEARQAEVFQLKQALDQIDDRITRLRNQLNDLD